MYTSEPSVQYLIQSVSQSCDDLRLFLLQEQVFVIPLMEVQSLRTIHPKKEGKLPSVSISYATRGVTKKVTVQLQQVTASQVRLQLSIEGFQCIRVLFVET